MNAQLHTPVKAASWLRERVTGSLCTDSRQLKAGDGFIAWPGAKLDARQFVREALHCGVKACLVEEHEVHQFALSDESVGVYHGLKAAAGPIAAAYYGAPSEQLKMVAVTGTNGKTSTAWWLAQALNKLDFPCGVIGTLGIGQPGQMVFNGLTTPDPVLLQQQLRCFVDQGLKACALEASSIGLAEHRLEATRIDVAVFTNFTQDHLDYHGSMRAYWQAKQALFAWPGLKAAVVNLDDVKGAALLDFLLGKGLDVWTVSCAEPARLFAKNISHEVQGLAFEVCEQEQSYKLETQLVGQYNVSNLLGVIAALRAMGFSLDRAVAACADLQAVPGRMEMVSEPGKPLVVVDYAHTPDALEKVLKALRPLATSRAGKLWCVFGCGGERDATKRPMMAAVAQLHADVLVLTSDNPRSESPQHIISQMLLGLNHSDAAQVQVDRAQAIADVLEQADARDVIVLAGKGHETYQDVAGVKQPFSDLAHARAGMQKQ